MPVDADYETTIARAAYEAAQRHLGLPDIPWDEADNDTHACFRAIAHAVEHAAIDHRLHADNAPPD